MKRWALTLALITGTSAVHGLEEADPALQEIVNFRQYSSTFASAGQPTREQFQTLAEAAATTNRCGSRGTSWWFSKPNQR